MTDEQINEALADFAGYWVQTLPISGVVPECCTDLNAMRHAENVYMSTPTNIQILEWWLDAVVQKRSKGTPIWHATARHRAEALLRALDKWEGK